MRCEELDHTPQHPMTPPLCLPLGMPLLTPLDMPACPRAPSSDPNSSQPASTMTLHSHPLHPSRRSDLLVTGKKGLDAFPGTDLEAQLKANGIETVVLAGFLTNCKSPCFQDSLPIQPNPIPTGEGRWGQGTGGVRQRTTPLPSLLLLNAPASCWSALGIAHGIALDIAPHASPCHLSS